MTARPQLAIFSPNPLLTVTIERPGAVRDEVHLHAGGQGVWVARAAARHAVEPILCGFVGGEAGVSLRALVHDIPGRHRLVPVAGTSGCYVMDRRAGSRDVMAVMDAPPASRHEVDDLVGQTVAAAVDAAALVVCNGYPATTVPTEVYGEVAAHAHACSVPVYADLSTPRLDALLVERPELVKLNDWELAEWSHGPVDDAADLVGAIVALREAGAGSVIVTRGARSTIVADPDGHLFVLHGPALQRGRREGCGDTMMGALAAHLAHGADWLDAVVLGAAAGTVNYLRRGLGTGDPEVVQRVAATIHVEPFAAASESGALTRVG